jgi:predicted DNA-binding protein with PD1-like motif
MPFVVISILVTITEDKEWFASVQKYAIAPGLVNSAMNWAIHACTNIKLRTAFKTIVLCREKGELLSLYYI